MSDPKKDPKDSKQPQPGPQPQPQPGPQPLPLSAHVARANHTANVPFPHPDLFFKVYESEEDEPRSKIRKDVLRLQVRACPCAYSCTLVTELVKDDCSHSLDFHANPFVYTAPNCARTRVHLVKHDCSHGSPCKLFPAPTRARRRNG